MQHHPETVHVKLWIQIKSLCMEEFYSLEEEENVQLNQNYRQLQDEIWTHVEQLWSTNEREKVLENSNHVRKTQATDILQPWTSNHVRKNHPQVLGTIIHADA